MLVIRDSGKENDKFHVADILCYKPGGELVYQRELSFRALVLLVKQATAILFQKSGGFI